MRRWIALLGTVLAFGLAWPASADLNWKYGDFEKKIQKLAVPEGEKSKLLCVCQEDGSKQGRSGWLESRQLTVAPDNSWALEVRCVIPTYESTAPFELSSSGFCLEFAILGK